MPSEFRADMRQLTNYLWNLVVINDAQAVSIKVAIRQTLEVHRWQSELGRAIATYADFCLGESPARIEGCPGQRQSWTRQLLPLFQKLQIYRKQLAFDQFAAYQERFGGRFRLAILPADALDIKLGCGSYMGSLAPLC
jgi:hypothetical protein